MYYNFLVFFILLNASSMKEIIPILRNDFNSIYGIVDCSNEFLIIKNGIAIYPAKEYVNFKIEMDILDHEGCCYGIFGYTELSNIDVEEFFNILKSQSSLADYNIYEYVRFCIIYYDKQSLKRENYPFDGHSYKAIWIDRYKETDRFNESGDIVRGCCIGRASSFAEPGLKKDCWNTLSLTFNNGYLHSRINNYETTSASTFPKKKLKIGFVAFGDQPMKFKNIQITELADSKSSPNTPTPIVEDWGQIFPFDK